MSKYIKQKVENKIVINELTGEISDLYSSKKVDMDEFIMVFMNFIPELRKLRPTEYRLLSEIWRQSSYIKNVSSNGNVFINDFAFKEECRNHGLKYDDKNINTYVSNLVKKGILIKINRARYVLNPKYFFKGTLNARMNAIVNIQYVDGFKVTTYDPIK